MGGEAEVIAHGRDREPWRPSRRLIGLAVVVSVLAAASVLGVQRVREQRDADAADRKAADAAVLDLYQDPTSGLWILRNQSPLALSIKTVTVDFPRGVQLEPASPDLRRYGSVGVTIANPGCDQSLYQRGPTELRVDAQTRRGLRLTRRVPLGTDATAALREALRVECRMLDPVDALSATLEAAERVGGTLRLRYDVGNRGVLPLRLGSVSYLAGVKVSVARPVLSLPGSLDGVVSGASLALTLTIESCREIERAVREGDYKTVNGTAELVMDVQHRYARGRAVLAVSDQWLPFLLTCPALTHYFVS